MGDTCIRSSFLTPCGMIVSDAPFPAARAGEGERRPSLPWPWPGGERRVRAAQAYQRAALRGSMKEQP